MLDPVWQHDRDHEDLEQQRPDALDDAERLRESFTREGVGAAGESTGPHTPEGRGRHEVDATASQSAVSACSPAADPFLHWPEHDRALARERAAALRAVSEPVCMERVRPATRREDLDLARGIITGFALSVPLWLIAVAVTWVIAW